MRRYRIEAWRGIGHTGSPTAALRALTLLELLAVVTLLTLAVGVAVVRLDGFSGEARLRSVARQMSAVLSLARNEARATGTPRLVAYADGAVEVRSPLRMAIGWTWSEPRIFRTGDGVRLDRVLMETGTIAGEPNHLRIGPDGRLPLHGVVLAVGDRYAVAVADAVGGTAIYLPPRRPEASAFDLLLLEVRAHHAPR